ncbi:cell adhesion molecule CEACAM3-like isoform X2 [Siphateles boraxobius]|uniref:cell adhesion molecule CEACAM3-like isoform X2 n=1 Tax=Siphateles boraxobius TaxID=180520 RepID=UPI0040631D8E
MTSTSNPVLFVLLLSGVFGVEADEVKTETVMEGESVILNTDLTEIQEFHEILWRFGKSGSVIAVTDGTEISYPHHTEIFSGRLQIDHQTGSLTIKNMRIKHSGLYKLHISSNSGTSSISFSVTVYESPTDAVIDAGEAEMKTVSVMEGDFFILQTDVNETHGDELIVWRFDRKLITKCDIEAKSLMNDTDERFRDRLQLDHQTGSLNVTNTRTADSGVYTVKISSSKQTLYNKFSVTVSVLSSGAVAGIVIVVLLLVFSAAAASFYYRHIICSPKPLLDADKTVSVKEGESVTLRTDAEIQNDDQIQWMFGPQKNLIAEIRGETRENSTYHGAAGRFRDRLSLDEKTGSLIITNITAEHIGVYELQTSSSRGTSYQRFIVTVKITLISLVEGEPVTLYPDTEIQKDDVILWMFGDEDTLIAQMTEKYIFGRKTREATDGRFGDQLKLDKRTGSLTIKSTRTEHSGLYKLQITRSNRGTINERFKVAINLKKVSAKEGESVTLKTNAVIQRKDELLWLFGDENTPIAEIKGGIGKISTFGVADSRFRDRLQLDEKTGSLIITNITTEHAGVYTLKIISSKLTKIERYNVTVRVLKTIGMRGKNVTLNPDTEVQRDDLILWMFGDQDNLIAQLTGETGETTYDADERFRDKLKLNKNTGSLSISDITSGPYNLQIISSKRTSYRKFRVFKSCESGPKTVPVMAGECLVLITDFKERHEKVEWKFENKILTTGMNGDISKTFYSDDVRFRGRLELHHQTGSLTIKDTRTSDTGVYHLNLCSRGGKNIIWECSVTVSDSR